MTEDPFVRGYHLWCVRIVSESGERTVTLVPSPSVGFVNAICEDADETIKAAQLSMEQVENEYGPTVREQVEDAMFRESNLN